MQDYSAESHTSLRSVSPSGRMGGRKPKLTEVQKQQVRKLNHAKGLTVREIAALFNHTTPAVYWALEDAQCLRFSHLLERRHR